MHISFCAFLRADKKKNERYEICGRTESEGKMGKKDKQKQYRTPFLKTAKRHWMLLLVLVPLLV